MKSNEESCKTCGKRVVDLRDDGTCSEVCYWKGQHGQATASRDFWKGDAAANRAELSAGRAVGQREGWLKALRWVLELEYTTESSGLTDVVIPVGCLLHKAITSRLAALEKE